MNRTSLCAGDGALRGLITLMTKALFRKLGCRTNVIGICGGAGSRGRRGRDLMILGTVTLLVHQL